MEIIPILIFWVVAVLALFQRRHVMIYVFFATMPFGAFAVIPTELTKGLTFTPTPIVALLLIAKQLFNINGFARIVNNALNPSKILFLFLFWLTAVVTTAFMPRFFANQIQIVPVRLGDSGDTAALFPTTQNFSQFVYITISVLTVFVFADLLRSKNTQKHAIYALCVGAGIAAFTGFLDFLSQYTPIKPFLEIFRTASYGLLTDVEVLNAKRVVGLMPEASAYGSLVLSYLSCIYFFRHAQGLGKMRNYIMPFLIVALIVFIWLSTSSAAYLGLALFGIVVILDWVWRFSIGNRNPYLKFGIMNEFWGAMIAFAILLIVIVIKPELLSPIQDLINETIFRKSGSSSFEERGMWTRVSWQALLDTYGLGVGLGATRASNFAIALVSNVGAIGSFFYVLFLLLIFVFKKISPLKFSSAAYLLAIRFAFLPPFFTSLTIGTTADFGLFNAFLFGFAISLFSKESLINNNDSSGHRTYATNVSIAKL